MTVNSKKFDAAMDFADKVTPDIDFTDEAVVWCDVPVLKIFLKVMAIPKRSQPIFWYECLRYNNLMINN